MQHLEFDTFKLSFLCKLANYHYIVMSDRISLQLECDIDLCLPRAETKNINALGIRYFGWRFFVPGIAYISVPGGSRPQYQ